MVSGAGAVGCRRLFATLLHLAHRPSLIEALSYQIGEQFVARRASEFPAGSAAAPRSSLLLAGVRGSKVLKVPLQGST